MTESPGQQICQSSIQNRTIGMTATLEAGDLD